MNTLVVSILIVLLNLSVLVNLTTAEGEIGESICGYFGEGDPDNIHCHSDLLNIKYLPEECTAYVYNGITCNEMLEIIPTYNEEDIETIKSLVENKPNKLFLYYARRNFEEALFTEDPSAEAQKVKDFVDKYPVKGLILCGVQNVFLRDGDDFYQKFSAYVKAFKTKMPDLKIASYLKATDMISKKNDAAWFDFCKMNDVIDFYIIEFTSFNSCIDELLHGGITPLVSTNPDVNTLTSFAAALNASTIAKDKVFFEFSISPIAKLEVQSSFLPCEFSYNKYCEINYDTTWCVDNQDTFYEKGQFAKQYARGFIARDLDLVDRDLKCQCQEDKYITFQMLLNGYKSAEKITCDLFKF